MKKYSILAAAVLLALGGCGGKDAAEHYDDAKQYLQQKNISAATIELKSAVQQDPQNQEYRIALAQAHAAVGDMAAAAKEYDKAIGLGADKSRYLVPLFKAWFLAKDSKSILSEYQNDSGWPADVKHYVNFYRAFTELETGETEKAQALFTPISEQSDAKDAAVLAATFKLILDNNVDAALDKVKAVQQTDKLYDESLLITARLYQQKNMTELANQHFQKYLANVPQDYTARLMLVQGLLQINDLELADKELAPVLKIFPKHPLANSLKAHILYDKKDYTAAKEAAEVAIYGGLSDVRTRVLAAVSAIQLDLRSQALAHLDAVKDALGQNSQISTMYNMLLLDAGRVSEVNESLKNQDPSKLDYKIVASTVHKLMRSGDVANARQLMDKFEAIANDNADVKTTLASLKMDMSGMQQQGLADLESTLAADPTQDKARVVLVQSYIRSQQFDKALQLIDRWINEEKTATIGYNLKAYVLFLQGKDQLANEWVNKSLSLDKTNPFALLLKSAAVMKTGDKAAAETILSDIIKQHPAYVPALVQYFTLMTELKKQNVALDTIRNIQKANSDNPVIRLTLASFESSLNNNDAVIRLLTDGKVKDDSKTPEYWGMLIQAYMRGDNSTQALLTAKQWLQAAPDDVNAILTNTQLLARLNDRREALSFLDNALAKRPDNQLLLRAMAMLLADDSQYKKAIATIDKMGPEAAGSAEMLFVKARMLFADGDVPQARQLAKQSYDKAPSPMALTLLAELAAKNGDVNAAIAVIRQHLEKHGERPEIKAMLANYLIPTNPTEALSIYKSLSGQFNDYLVQNNYAWLLSEAGDQPGAEKEARKALELSPDHPDVLDTLATILMKQNKVAEAKQHFEKSLKVRPKHPQVSLHYAQALAANGDKVNAAKVLADIETKDASLLQQINALKSQLN